MPHPTRDQLTAAALPGEPTDEVVTAHLAGCPACAAEVAALGRTVGLARDGLALAGEPPPPPAVWSGILAQLDDDLPDGALPGDLPGRPGTVGGGRRRNGHRHPGPRFAQDVAQPAPRRRRRVVVAGLAIAAVAAAVAVLSPALGGLLDPSGGAGPTAVARVALVSADPGVSGEAVMGPGPVMHVDVVVPAGVPAGHTLEVWAVEPGGMRPLGALAPAPDRSRWAGELVLPADPADAAQRPALDVSVEPAGPDPRHSGHSLAHSP
ncbi:anti-sigma factor domain-containing protein [Actinomycetospora atypica]|uniref:Anti-sigma factor domain-containing protein n=1 Tax=Actinomycetospora atypica TaxID=1290095 RepID=A0ABV9YJN0_9PSEU